MVMSREKMFQIKMMEREDNPNTWGNVFGSLPRQGLFCKEEFFMTLEEKVIGIIVEQLDVTREECVPEASFIDDLGADSLDLVELIMEMEETFDVQIADNELQQIRSIKDVLDYLRNKGIAWHE
jgi:acyl carrier protein